MGLHEDFELLVDRNFTEEDENRAETDALVNPYTTELLVPTRTELLALFEVTKDLCEDLIITKKWDELGEAFSEAIAGRIGAAPGTEVMVANPNSFFSAEGIAIVDEGANIFGDYLLMFVGPWEEVGYTAFEAEGETGIRTGRFHREFGLQIVLAGAVLEQQDQTRVWLGEVHIPLEHGNPELYRVLR